MTGMFTTQKSTSTVVVVAFYITFLALVNAIDEDVRPSDEPSECMCKFPKHNTPESALLNDIRPLCGRR